VSQLGGDDLKKFIIILLLIIIQFLAASVTVEYLSEMSPEQIATTSIKGIEYFNVYELNKAFKAIIKQDLIDQRLKINLYGCQLIILLESSFLSCNGKVYNFTHPVLQEKGKLLLPEIFLTRLLPVLFPDKIIIHGNRLKVADPVDNKIRTIVLDPGHGGKDPGAIGYSGSTYEKDLVLQIALKLQQKLEKELDVDVILTRDKDEFVSLQERAEIANRNNADLFISIHINAHNNSNADGIEVYYLSTAKTDGARAVEALENSVVYDYEGGEEAVKKYDDLAFILADMAQNEHLEESYQQSMKLQQYLVNETESRDRGVKQANFYVLRGAFMPAVLLELGYITNKAEEKKLKKSAYQDMLVNAIFKGIKDFKYKFDRLQ
jgi:N-acetylmuramoyl-L-alanine amidase